MTPSIEKTPIGMQYVIPGAERIPKPRRRAFKTDGDQLVIPGAERISTKEYLARLAERPIAPRNKPYQYARGGTALARGRGAK